MIDRALVNTEWMLHMPIMEVNILKLGIFDHSQLKIVLDKICKNTYNNSRFFNILLIIQSLYNQYKRHGKEDRMVHKRCMVETKEGHKSNQSF